MRNVLIIGFIIGIAYLGFRFLSSDDPSGPSENPPNGIGVGSGEPGWDSAGAGPEEGGAGSDSTGIPQPAVVGDDPPARPVPAVGEIPTLEKAIEGTLSPEKDDLRIRLADAYLESGRDSEADDLYRQVFRAAGPRAGSAAAALLDRSAGAVRTELAAFIVSRGEQTPGYAAASLIHGEALASSETESEQIEAWRLLSAAYFSRPEESWRVPIRARLEPIVSRWLLSPRPCSVTTSYQIQSGDSLGAIAEEYHVTIDQLRALNGIESDLIHPGDRVKILERPITVEVDKSEYRLNVRYDGGFLMSFPVGHGSHGRTPVADFEVNLRQVKPTWFPANRPSIAYGEPGNPLGERWIGFASAEGFKGFGIHGTNQPETIGTEASEGCVRLRNEDVIRVYPFISLGTKVRIQE